jgi:two-component sensor histidine kinase
MVLGIERSRPWTPSDMEPFGTARVCDGVLGGFSAFMDVSMSKQGPLARSRLPFERLGPPERPGPPFSSGWTLKACLSLLAICCTMPIAFAAVGLVYLVSSQEYQRAEREIADRTAFMLEAVELRTQNIREDLQVLAMSPALQAGDLEAFREHMIGANRIYNAFGTVLVDRSGQLIISTRRQAGERLPKRTSLEVQERVFVTGMPQISDLVASTAADAPIISIEVPVTIDGQVRYVLAAGLSPEYVAEVMRKHVPQGWLGSIVDRRGLLVSRVPDLQLVGQPIIPNLRGQVGKTSAKWIETTSRDGTRIYSFSHVSSELGWTAFISTPRALVGNLRWNTAVLAGFVGLAISLGLVSASWLSRRIVNTLGAFEENVASLGRKADFRKIPNLLIEVNRMQDALIDVKRELDSTEQRIDQERSLLKATVQAMPIGVLIVARDGRVLLVNPKALELWATDKLEHVDDFKGISRRHIDGTPYPPEEWPIARALHAGAVIQNEEVVHLHQDGSKVRLSISAAPVRDQSGRIIAAVAAFYDTTELNGALDQHKLLLEEINHRVNNTMSTIQAIAVLTRTGVASVDEYVQAFQKRLIAMAHAYRLLTDNNWEGADLHEIAKLILAPYGEAKIELDGPPTKLSANHTLAIAAALQELGTNAAKYGSLSVASGRLKLRWSVQTEKLDLKWEEFDGPVVKEPTRRGFGTRFIQDTLSQQVQWKIDARYPSDGFKLWLSLPLQ